MLRSDPVFKLIAGRSPQGNDLASQPTLSRFENAIDVKSLRRLREVLVDQFIASFEEPPTRITLDIDPFDDPTHGQQQLTFFHGYYQQYQYLPRAITCAENDLVVMLCLLFGTAHPALGADEEGRASLVRILVLYGKTLLRGGRTLGLSLLAILALAGRRNGYSSSWLQRLAHLLAQRRKFRP